MRIYTLPIDPLPGLDEHLHALGRAFEEAWRSGVFADVEGVWGDAYREWKREHEEGTCDGCDNHF